MQMRWRSRQSQGPPRTKFSAHTEKVICGYVLSQAYAKSPVTIGELQDFIRHLCEEEVSHIWVSGFVDRFAKVLRIGTAGIEPKTRHPSSLLTSTEKFIDSFERWQQMTPISGHSLMNCDEKRACFSNDGTYRILARGEYNANIEQPRGVALFSMLPFVQANGRLFAIFYFFGASQQEETVVWLPQSGRRSRDDPHRFVATTPTSYLERRTLPHGVSSSG